jgi:hypothetical protein
MTNSREPIKVVIHAKIDAEDPLYVLISFYHSLIIHELVETGAATREQVDHAANVALSVLAAMHRRAEPNDKKTFLASTFKMLGLMINHVTEAMDGNPLAFFGPTMNEIAKAGGLNVADLQQLSGPAAQETARRVAQGATATPGDLELLAMLEQIQGRGQAKSEAEERIMMQVAEKLGELRRQRQQAEQPKTVAEQFMGDIWGDD